MKVQLHKRLKAIVEAVHVISPRVLSNERELATSKWYAYRFMSPLEATQEFGRCYQVALKRYIQENVDIDMVHRVSGISLAIPEKPDRAYSQLWLARQDADRRGIPYEDYLEFCFDFAAARQRKIAPRPGQLRSNEKTTVAWEEKFNLFLADRLEHILRNAQLPQQYRFESFRGLSSQVAFRNVIRHLIANGGRPIHMEIADWCGEKRMMPIRSSVDPVHRHLIKSAIATIRHDRSTGIMSMKPESLSSMTNIDYWPSCMGVPYAKENSSSECMTCPFSTECGMVSNRVLTVTNKPNSPTPEDAEKDRERAMIRERVRRYRARALLPSTQAVTAHKKLHSKNNRKQSGLSGET
jgi:hypothetical protein